MPNNILVTVYIPTYNRTELLKRAIDSVLNQTYKNIELIVVDDCSTDNTIEYLNELVQKDFRIKYFQNGKNSGACVSRNKAIREAKGKFITGLDDDDYFLPNRIEDFLKSWNDYVSKNSKIICLFSNLSIKNKLEQNNYFRIIKKPVLVKQKDLLVSNWIGNQIFTKTSYLKNVFFDENLPMWQDLDCWYRLLSENKFGYNIKNASYVLDTSHPHERISSKKINTVYETFEYLSKKYKLNSKEKSILEGQIFSYDLKSLNLIKIFKLFLSHKNFNSTKILLKKLLKRI